MEQTKTDPVLGMEDSTAVRAFWRGCSTALQRLMSEAPMHRCIGK